MLINRCGKNHQLDYETYATDTWMKCNHQDVMSENGGRKRQPITFNISWVQCAWTPAMWYLTLGLWNAI